MTPEKRKRFGRRFRGVRQRMRLTQVQLAAKLGVSEATVSRWENGLHEPDIPQRIKLDAIFGAPLEELMKVDPADWEKDGPKAKMPTAPVGA
jgi:transcriptional regulator with XRE-family HTH domain